MILGVFLSILAQVRGLSICPHRVLQEEVSNHHHLGRAVVRAAQDSLQKIIFAA